MPRRGVPLPVLGMLVTALAAHACGKDELVGKPSSEASAGSDTVQGGLDAGGTSQVPDSAGLGGGGPADPQAGQAGALDCLPEALLTDSAVPAHGLSLSGVSVLQAVNVPVMERLIETPERHAEVLAGRPGLLRAYVKPGAGWRTRAIRGRLTLRADDEVELAPSSYEQTRVVTQASTDGDVLSTFNFELGADSIGTATSYALELYETETCNEDQGESNGARFPETGDISLRAVEAPSLRVLVVPVEMHVENEVLLPDTSAKQLELLRREVIKLFPIADIEMTVRDLPLSSAASDMLGVLDEVAALRDEENGEPDLTYYGMVRFGPDIFSYCAPTCVLGSTVNPEAPSGGVAVGVGYTGAKAAVTFAHELGHVYGRPHSPCGVVGDPAFPYSGGGIGGWGYDILDEVLVDPTGYTDFMGYCMPTWVSDYTFEHLFEFIAQIPVGPSPANAPPTSGERRRFRTLIREANGKTRWGRSRVLRRALTDRAEHALVRGADAAVQARVTVHRFRLGDDGTEMVYVPDPLGPEWRDIEIRGWPAQAIASENAN